MSEESDFNLSQKNDRQLKRDAMRDHEDSSKRLGEIYEDLNDFTETKRKIEELIRLKQSLIDLKNSDAKLNSEKFKEYKGKAIEAINNLFDEAQPGNTKL